MSASVRSSAASSLRNLPLAILRFVVQWRKDAITSKPERSKAGKVNLQRHTVTVKIKCVLRSLADELASGFQGVTDS